MSAQYKISFIEERCIQCHGCSTACKSWNEIEPGIHLRQIKNVWHGKYPKVKISSLSMACRHCKDPECMAACPVKAITKSKTNGVVIVDKEKCTGCKICLKQCPYDIPQFGEDKKMYKCDMCIDKIDFEKTTPPCVETCPTNALLFSNLISTEK